MLLCRRPTFCPSTDPHVVFDGLDLQTASRATTPSQSRHPTSDHHANVLSAISALTATFHFSRGPGDLRAQTGRSRGACERQASLREDSLSLSPGQFGSIPRLNGQGAGDYFSLAEMQKFEPSDDPCCTMQIARLINCLAPNAGIARSHLGWKRTRAMRATAMESPPADQSVRTGNRRKPSAITTVAGSNVCVARAGSVSSQNDIIS